MAFRTLNRRFILGRVERLLVLKQSELTKNKKIKGG